MGSATAMTDCELSAHRQEGDDGGAFIGKTNSSDMFVAYLLARKSAMKEDFSRPALQFQ